MQRISRWKTRIVVMHTLCCLLYCSFFSFFCCMLRRVLCDKLWMHILMCSGLDGSWHAGCKARLTRTNSLHSERRS